MKAAARWCVCVGGWGGVHSGFYKRDTVESTEEEAENKRRGGKGFNWKGKSRSAVKNKGKCIF